MVWTCSMDLFYGPVLWTCSMDLFYDYPIVNTP